MISPLATLNVTGSSSAAAHGVRKTPVHGLVVHTTGSGVPNTAKKRHKDAMQVALEIYCRGPNAAHYVIDHAGVIAQVLPDDVIGWHVGGGDDKRNLYLSGLWRERCAKAAIEAWDRKWYPAFASPQHLFPGTSVNAIYVGVELIPCIAGLGQPAAFGGSFTEAQYPALIALGIDLAVRHGWPKGWAETPRLIGHEDVGLLDRHDAGGGWDPAYLRAVPRFDFERVRKALTP